VVATDLVDLYDYVTETRRRAAEELCDALRVWAIWLSVRERTT
jgi:hypothetical protein